MTAEIEVCDANFDILGFIFKKYVAKVRLFCKLCNFYFKKNQRVENFLAVKGGISVHQLCKIL